MLERALGGFGSFRTRVELPNLDLGDFDPFNHSQSLSPSFGFLQLT
jgi:hypothetical protein